MRVFLINNGRYSIVDKGLEKIMPQVNKENYHCNLAPINFIMAATAHGWMGIKLNPNLSNLELIMSLCYSDCAQSILIEIPIDPDQDLGINNHLEHLK